MRSRLTSAAILAVVGLIGAPLGATAGEISWYQDVNTAWQAAVKHQAPMLIFVTSPGCKYCTMMKRDTYSNPDIAQWVNESFVPVKIDAKRARRLVKDLGVRAFPTTLVVSPDANVVARIQGYVSPREFKQRLDATLRNEMQTAQRVSGGR